MKNCTSQFIKNLKSLQSSFKSNIWGPDLADMQLISKFENDFDFYCY